MSQVGIAELKAKLSQYVARVKSGEQITVTDRGRPVARLVPPGELRDDDEYRRLLDLERRGVVRIHGTGRVPEEFWDLERPADPEGLVLKALLEERAEGW